MYSTSYRTHRQNPSKMYINIDMHRHTHTYTISITLSHIECNNTYLCVCQVSNVAVYICAQDKRYLILIAQWSVPFLRIHAIQNILLKGSIFLPIGRANTQLPITIKQVRLHWNRKFKYLWKICEYMYSWGHFTPPHVCCDALTGAIHTYTCMVLVNTQ